MTIKDVMVRLDGTSGDDARLAAANQIAEIFDSHITRLFFNVLSSRIPDGLDGVDAKRLRATKEAGDAPETMVFQRLTRLHDHRQRRGRQSLSWIQAKPP
jgi:hypothetical protein